MFLQALVMVAEMASVERMASVSAAPYVFTFLLRSVVVRWVSRVAWMESCQFYAGYKINIP
jgi:hypothetical protein